MCDCAIFMYICYREEIYRKIGIAEILIYVDFSFGSCLFYIVRGTKQFVNGLVGVLTCTGLGGS
jgi:hypothetical protein